MRAPTLRLPRPASLPLGLIGLVLFLIAFALLAGAATALAGTLAVFVFGGLVIGTVAFLVPLPWMVVGLFVMSFVVTGQIMYFGGISKANWIPFLIGVVLLLRFPIDMMQRRRARGAVRDDTAWQVRAMKLFIVLFFATLLASTLINVSPPIQILVTSKQYVFLWGLYLVLAAGLIKPEFIERIWSWLPWLLPLQLPLVLYQRFVVMPRTTSRAKWDVIVGAFGGNPEGGGASAAMGFFCLIGIFIAIYRHRAGLMLRWQMILITVSGILAIGLAEVKFMILLLPICFTIAYSRDILRNPLKGILLVAVGFVLSLGIFLAYKAQYSNPYTTSTKQQYLESMFYGQTETSFVNVRSRSQGRLAGLIFWFKNNSLEKPAEFLIGQGMGSAQTTMTFVGRAQATHFERLDRSAMAILLWETGLLGTLLYLGILGSAYLATRNQALANGRTAAGRATSQSMAIAIVVLAASLPYNTDLIGAHQIQLLVFSCIGYAAMKKTQVLSLNESGFDRRVPLRVSATK